MISVRLTASLLLLALAAAGAAAAPLRVVVSVAPQAELATRLGGEAIAVTVLVPPGADVETYAPTPQQMAALESAGLVFTVGHPSFPLERAYLEPWLERHRGIRQVSLAAHARGVPSGTSGGHLEEHSGEHGDPHLWVSPRTMRGAARELAGALALLLPAETARIEERWRRLDAEIEGLDRELEARLRAAAGRAFVIYHPALGYLASDYGLEQWAIEHEGKEPSPARLGRLIASARRERVRVVLVQPGMPKRSAELLAREIGARLLEVDPVAADWLANTRALGAALEAALDRG